MTDELYLSDAEEGGELLEVCVCVIPPCEITCVLRVEVETWVYVIRSDVVHTSIVAHDVTPRGGDVPLDCSQLRGQSSSDCQTAVRVTCGSSLNHHRLREGIL